MKHEHWDDEIESLLKQAPKMRDTRSKDEVFKQLQQEGMFNEQPVLPPKRVHWKPLIVSIASIFVLVLLASKFIGTTPELSIEQSNYDNASQEDLPHDTALLNIDGAEMERVFMAPQRTALYAEQVGEQTVFTIGLAGDDAESVPVSILIPQEQIRQDFGQHTPTKLELYEHYAPLLNEEALGFNDYHPFVGQLTEQGKTLTHQLPANQPYDMGTAAQSNYLGVLIDTFQSSYEEVAFVDELGEPFIFSQVGTPAEPLQLTSEYTQYNYFLYTMRNGSQYISPNFRMSNPDVETALRNMTLEANDIYQTLILPNVTFKTAVGGQTVTVTFDELLDLEQHDPQATLRMLEGILLTAGSFDKNVNFKNISQEQWYDFDFSKPISAPIAPNLLDFSFVSE